jgi:hypothetical protein
MGPRRAAAIPPDWPGGMRHDRSTHGPRLISSVCAPECAGKHSVAQLGCFRTASSAWARTRPVLGASGWDM